MSNWNKVFKPIVVLCAICIVVTAALAATNAATAPVIEAATLEAQRQARMELLPDADNFTEVTGIQVENVSAVYTADNGAGVVYTGPEAQRNAKYAVWEAQNPDWNKVWLIPVNAHYSTSTNIYGGTTKVLLSIKNALSMNSVRLKGGTNSDLSIDVVYTKFND